MNQVNPNIEWRYEYSLKTLLSAGNQINNQKYSVPFKTQPKNNNEYNTKMKLEAGPRHVG